MTSLAIARPGWLIAGIVIFLLGVWLWRWSSRNSIDIKGAAVGAAWQGVRQGRLDVPDDLKQRYNDVAGESTNSKRALKAANMGARHFMAKVVGLMGLAGILGGLALAAVGIWWK